jgi:hypothetical protein
MASTRPKTLLAKIETVPGTDSVPVVATDAIRIMDEVTVTPLDINYVPLKYARDYIGTDQELVAWFWTKLSLKIPVSGSGVAGTAPNADVLLRICGLSKTVVATTSVAYKDDVDTAFESATIYYFYAGHLHKALMCMGAAKVSLAAGEVPMWQIEITGLHGGVTDVTPGAPTFANFTDPVVCNKVNTAVPSLHAFGVTMYDFSFDYGNKVVYTNVPGIEDITLTDRDRTGSITIRDPLVATKDFWTLVKNATLGAFTLVHGTTAGNICTVSAANTQIKSPKYGDKDMNVTNQFDLRFLRLSKATAGITVTFT